MPEILSVGQTCYTGQYTGAGGTKSITGVGFQPKFLQIWQHQVGVANNTPEFVKTNQDPVNVCWYYQSGVGSGHITDAIVSLDVDGFTVKDAGANKDPNINGQVYNFVCWR
jgi:hypothetical protein